MALNRTPPHSESLGEKWRMEEREQRVSANTSTLPSIVCQMFCPAPPQHARVVSSGGDVAGYCDLSKKEIPLDMDEGLQPTTTLVRLCAPGDRQKLSTRQCHYPLRPGHSAVSRKQEIATKPETSGKASFVVPRRVRGISCQCVQLDKALAKKRW